MQFKNFPFFLKKNNFIKIKKLHAQKFLRLEDSLLYELESQSATFPETY